MTRICCSIALAAFILTACTKDASFAGSTGESQAVVHITTNLHEIQAQVDTKSTPEDFYPADTYYGIFACIHEDTPTSFARFKPATFNSGAVYKSGWKYHNVVDYTSGQLISTGTADYILMGRTTGEHADLFAYYPYTQSAYTTGPTAIPFSRNTDLMYAEQNSSNANGDKDPASGSALTANFTFKRMMARLTFCFKMLNDNSTMYVTLESVKNNHPAGGSVVIYTGGTYNAITGSFNSGMITTDELTSVGGGYAGYSADPAAYPSSFGMFLVPTTVSVDDELTFTFSCGGHVLPPFTLKASQVLHSKASPSDPDVYGFQAGYNYTFRFTLDNYVRFDGFTIGTWTDEILPRTGEI